MTKRLLLLLAGLASCVSAFAQTDSLLFDNDILVIGEIKSMERGVLIIETDFSDDDFKIEWEKIKEFKSEVSFLINTTDGMRYYGTLRSIGENQLQIITDEGVALQHSFDEIIYLKSVDKGFLDRLNANIDLGYSITRAQNQRQFTMRSGVGYLAERWAAGAAYNTLNSQQDDVEDIRRTDGFVSFKFLFPHDWFLMIRNDFLSNTEQFLDLRSNLKLGAGKYLFRTNSWYWAFMGGGSYMRENFTSEDPDRNSAEAWFGTEANLFDIGDLTFSTNLTAYSSFSEKGRWRIDYGLDLKYDLPLDFYISTGLTLNFDNQPADSAPRTDYVWQTGFGWEW